ncbi:MAG: 5'-nucleotidase [Bacteroidota bacterium]
MKASHFIVLLFSLLLSACATYQHPQTVNDASQPIGPEIVVSDSPTAEAVADLIAPYEVQLTAQMNREIGQVAETMRKGRPESGLGNWLGDLLQTAAEAVFPEQDIDFAVQNYGGIRIPELSTGPLRVGSIYELMPFDNELVLVEMNGFVLNEFIQHMASNGGWPVSKELRYRIEGNEAKDIEIKGVAIQFNRNYRVALPDYVANGGSDASMLKDRKQIKCGQLIRDLLLKYAEQQKEALRPQLDGRVSK